MATVKGVINTALVNVQTTGPAAWQTAGYINGREKANLDYYVGLGTEAAATVILMGAPLPVGAKVISHSLQISASIGSFTVSVGDGLSAARYSTNTALATANTIVAVGTVLNTTDGYYVVGTNAATTAVPTGDTQIQLTTGGATLTAGTIIAMRTIFVTD